MNQPVIERLPQTAPNDKHNRELVARVHPEHWSNPTPQGRYHLVVIGAGTAGLVAAAGAAGLGARVALIEKDLMGGDCLNVGCVPSKALLSAARMAKTVRRAGDFGMNIGGDLQVDFSKVMERMRSLRTSISPHDSAERFKKLGVDVFFGEARFQDAGSIQVGGAVLDFRRALIAAGSRASVPPIPGLQEAEYLTNKTLFTLTELPRRLAIIGAGPIGCEMAQAFANFGAEVFLVETAHGVLPREESAAAELVKKSLLEDGVQLLCCGKELRIRRENEGIRLSVSSHEKQYDQAVDQLLVAAGRTPNVENLGLEAAGVKFDEKTGVQVDDRLRTSNRRVFAAGDICSKYQFTHAADVLARIVLQNALFPGRAKAGKLVIPWCTYTSPELARVGLSLAEAEEKGIEVDVYKIDLGNVDRAILEGQTEGFAQVLVKKGTDRILGATIVAENAGDLISLVTQAMTHGLGLKQIAATIYPYPTQAEAVRKLGDQYNRTRLTDWTKWLFQKWFSWTS